MYEGLKGEQIMTVKKHCPIPVVITLILSISALGDVRPERVPGVIGQPNPALGGIEQLYVVIQTHSSEPNKDGLVREELKKLVRGKLEKEAGIVIAEDDVEKIKSDSTKKVAEVLKKRLNNFRNLEFRHANIPEFIVDIDMLRLNDSQVYVFRVQSSLARKVVLPIRRNLSLKADVWETKPVMQAVSVEVMPRKVTREVLEQLKSFISCYQIANPNSISARPGTAQAVSKTGPGNVVAPLPARYKYIGSKNSKVFHRPGCYLAERINPQNLTVYSSREEAIKAGKRPCKRCKP